MWNGIAFSLLIALWCTDKGYCQCKQRDVAFVIELPNGDQSAAEHAKSFVEEMKEQLKPSPQCTKLAFIFSWIKAQPVINMRCDYGGCYKNGLRAIDRLIRLARRTTRPYQKQSLIESMRLATDQLYSKTEGARVKAEKVLVLVLSNPPNKNAPATEEEIKDYHDMRIKVVAVGVGAGRTENLADIVVDDQLKLKFENFGTLVEVGVGRISKIIKGYTVARLGFNAGARGPPGIASGSALQEPDQSRAAKLNEDQKDTCNNIVDIAFIMDSSGSVRKQYNNEKFFVQRIASRFGIIEAGSHGGVVLFSSHGYIKTVIKFTDFLTTKSFNEAIAVLPFYGYMTRIDTALKLAHTELYTVEGRARPNVKKLLFLITDGRQNPDIENGKRLDPAREAEKLHLSGVQVYAVGVGSKVNHTELSLITRDKSKVYMASDFKELVSDAFVTNVSKRMCEDAGLLPTATVTMKPFTRPAGGLEKPCNKTSSNCGCGCGCGCGCCAQKSPVYINIFKGANSKNYLMQGAHVTQNGGSNSLGSLGFKEIHSSPNSNSTALKDMNSNEIANLIKDLLPYQQQFNGGLKELLRRALAKEGKKRRRREISQETTSN